MEVYMDICVHFGESTKLNGYVNKILPTAETKRERQRNKNSENQNRANTFAVLWHKVHISHIQYNTYKNSKNTVQNTKKMARESTKRENFAETSLRHYLTTHWYETSSYNCTQNVADFENPVVCWNRWISSTNILFWIDVDQSDLHEICV